MSKNILEIKEGIYDSLDIEVYHEGPGLSSSAVKLLLESPYKYYKKYVEKSYPAAGDEKASLLFGRALHFYVLEPDLFKANYRVLEKIDMRFKENKIKREQELIEAERDNLTIILEDNFEKIKQMANSISLCEVGDKILKKGQAEKSFYWKDEGRLLKCRPDFLHTNFILDIKSTQNSSVRKFNRDVENYSYHLSAAMYLDGVKHLTGKDRDFIFLAMEKEFPFVCEWYTIDESTIELGRELYKTALKILDKCEKTNVWPMYCIQSEEHSLTLGQYAHQQLCDLKTKWGI